MKYSEYSAEVKQLLSEGGESRLASQYMMISRKLDEMSAKNRELLKENDDLKAKLEISLDGIEEILQLDFTSPIGFAKSLIEHRTTVEEFEVETDDSMFLVPEHEQLTFDCDELEEIAVHLLAYCEYNREE